MNPQAQIMAKQALLSVLALVCLAACPSWAIADQPSVNPTSMSFAAGGTIRLELNKGTMEVVGVPGDKITVSWHSPSSQNERDVIVKLQRFGEKNATIVVDGPGNRMRYHIEVPRQSNITIRMRAGELEVQDIAGSLDAELLAGEMDLHVAQPRHYRNVSASVTAGELNARPWHIETGGLWRSFKASGEGEYNLRAHLLAGQLRIRSE